MQLLCIKHLRPRVVALQPFVPRMATMPLSISCTLNGTWMGTLMLAHAHEHYIAYKQIAHGMFLHYITLHTPHLHSPCA